MIIAEAILAVTVVLVGLSAGFFFTFTTLIIPGLMDAQTKDLLKGFQVIDRRLQPNSPSQTWQPLVWLVLFGTSIMLVVSLMVNWSTLDQADRIMLIAANVVYTAGLLVTTVLRIVPFNNRVRDLDIDAMTPAQLVDYRREFEVVWTRWALVRAAATLTGFCLAVAVLA